MIVNLLQFIAVLASLIILHEVGHFLACHLFGVKVEEFGIGFPPRITKLFELGGTEYTLNWIPLGGFVKPLGEAQPEVEGGLAASKPGVRIGVYLAGPIMNILAAVAIYAVIFSKLGIPDTSIISIEEVVPQSPAAEAGLIPGDTILRINDVEPDNYNSLRGEIYAHLGEEIQIEYMREEEINQVSLVPRINPPENEGAIGILMTSPVKEINWFQALPLASAATANHSIAVLRLPGQLIRGTAEDAGRPVGYKGMYDIYAGAKEGQLLPGTSSQINVLLFLVSVTVSLGVLNLLPIPALDGGRILFVLPELLFGKRVSQSVQNAINAIGFISVIVLLIYFNILDFTSPVQLP
jgi:regulator of sigma E protease